MLQSCSAILYFENPSMKNNEGFFEMVYQVVRLIPQGRVTSYGAIARYLGSGQSARMVGWAMNVSHMDPEIPAHRVLNRSGLLTGKHHFWGKSMESLLEEEGIEVKDNQVQEFEKKFWDPEKELSL
jgi:methylated-DNA-protein-cysteine methyltransferase-like protein